MSIELFIFDWSGTISDDRRPVYEANMKVFETYGKERISFEEWLPRTTLTPVGIFRNHGIEDDAEKLFTLYKKYLDEAIKSGIVPTFYPDVHDTFSHLKNKGKKLAVLSSHPRENLVREATEYNLIGSLGLILGDSKDKVDGLKDVCVTQGIDAESSLYVGDTIYDIKAAKEAGVHSVGVCTGYHIRERLESEDPEFLLDVLSDLKGERFLKP